MLFETAFFLKMPVYKLLEMPYEELQGWNMYFDQKPFGWREDQRTALIMKSFGTKQSPENIFPSLARMDEHRRKNDPFKLRGSAFLTRLMTAKGGVKLEL